VRQHRLARLDELIAGGDHGDRRLACDPDARHARRGGDRDFGRTQAHARLRSGACPGECPCAAVNVLPRLYRKSAARWASMPRTLICSTGMTASQPPGSTAPVMTSMQAPAPASVCGGSPAGCIPWMRNVRKLAPTAAAVERDAVHRHAVKGRLIALRVDVLAQHGPRTLLQRQGFDGQAARFCPMSPVLQRVSASLRCLHAARG
jgi:hypothetical protein